MTTACGLQCCPRRISRCLVLRKRSLCGHGAHTITGRMQTSSNACHHLFDLSYFNLHCYTRILGVICSSGAYSTTGRMPTTLPPGEWKASSAEAHMQYPQRPDQAACGDLLQRKVTWYSFSQRSECIWSGHVCRLHCRSVKRAAIERTAIHIANNIL
jgi:hypothetical protein